MRALAHSPEGLRRFAALGDYARYRTRLSDRQREIVILITGRGVPYAWTHHEPLGRQAGLTEEEVASIRTGRVPDSFGGQDAALARLTRIGERKACFGRLLRCRGASPLA